MRFTMIVPLLLLSSFAVAPAAAHQASPEQRIDRLEKQVRQVQKRIFPKGQPADTAGFSDDPAATQASVTNLITRLDAVERQLAEMTRSSEENGNRIAVMEADLARLRADQERRLRALETAPAAAAAGAGPDAADGEPADGDVPPAPRPLVESPRPDATPAAIPEAGAEAAYDQGYRLWSAGQYDAAIRSLDAMIKAYPSNRRVSWAQNLAGRALLDKGQPRAAAERLLANYRRDPKGERAQDSLFYLGQSLVKLGQPGQACKAYGELEDVYGSNMRAPLRKDLPAAKSAARCG